MCYACTTNAFHSLKFSLDMAIQSVITKEASEPDDTALLATLLSGAGRYDEAKRAVLSGIERFPSKAAAFSEIGLKVVESTGDREFRKQIDLAVEAREK